MGVEQPRVGLLNVGEEPEKGTPVVAEAHALLRALEAPPFEFAGNVEGGGLTGGEADVVVTDGFTGNVAIKLMEGTTQTLVDAIRAAIRSGTLSKVGGLLIRGRLGELRARLDPETVAGAYLLGLRGPSSSATAPPPGGRSRTPSRSRTGRWRRTSSAAPGRRSRPPA